MNAVRGEVDLLHLQEEVGSTFDEVVGIAFAAFRDYIVPIAIRSGLKTGGGVMTRIRSAP